MAKVAPAYDPAVVKVGDGVRVDARGKGQGLAHDTVFTLGNKVCLPLQALYLPRAEKESCDGYDGEDD